MSIWGDIAGALVGIGGTVAGVATGNPALVLGGLSAAGSIIGSSQAAGAAEHAADTQAAAAQQGLDFQKQVYGQRRSDLQPAIGYGGAAANRLGYLLGLEPNAAPSSMPGVAPQPPAPAPAAAVAPSGPGTGHGLGSLIARDTGRNVLVRAPSGESKAMPYDQAQAYLQHYPQAGLQIVGGA